ncbi:beta-glucan synthesis-associated [Tricharina praecox]|uniref:beta-glucan synthesis-associated n=1 Tax=Tricharina praecox TaxID=43433 RepID=UPI002220DCDF|nr:beta-glucan synthesis-associated [Tricharina praecox]KAI5842865.1 beta-glucan synthesis-associated [Tricharina praecox]
MCFILLMIGPAVLFIVWPIVTYGHLGRDNSDREGEEISKHKHPILGAVRTSLIDPDTPKYAMTRDSVLGQGKLKLVFSDEFNQDGRTFYEGDDQFWQAADFHYAATNDLEWYDPDAITTANGTLQIKMQAIPNHNLDYRSGMLQSWNKMCFKGGVMEVSASLAGPAGVPGLWPGIWTLGNLARPGYRATSDGVWPYSYDQCDAGITPNQSSADGLSFLPGQRLAKCVCTGEDHPTPGRGRGAPEIDALEGAAEYDMRVGVVTQSSQVAPFDIWYRVDHNFLAIRDTKITQLNGWRGGPYQQAITGVTMLNNDWYDEYQKYAFEYIPGQEDGAIAWFVGDDETFRMSGKATGPNGNIGQRDISREPMSIILNLGMSSSWTWIDWATLGLAEGTTMYIDYVRIYQKEGEESITCDPPGYATTSYIRKHPKAYQNSNLTTWDDTGYPWPKNELMHGCE